VLASRHSPASPCGALRVATLLSLLLVACFGCTVQEPSTRQISVNIQSVKGPIRVGTGAIGSVGDVNVDKNTAGSDLNAVLAALRANFGGTVELLAGDYYGDMQLDMSGPKPLRVVLQPGVTWYVRHAGPVGFAWISANDSSIQGAGRIVVDTWVNDQVAIRVDGTRRCAVEDVQIDYLATGGTTSNPMIGVLFSGTWECSSRNLHVYPATGVVGVRQQLGLNNLHQSFHYTYGAPKYVSDVFTGRQGYLGFDAIDTQWCTLRDFHAFGVGDQSTEDVGTGVTAGFTPGVRPKAMIRFTGTGAIGSEDGHSIIDSPVIELCATQAGLLLEGAGGWIDVDNFFMGIGNGGIYKLGDAAIKITNSGARDTARVRINGGQIHNLGRDQATAQIYFATLKGTLTSATQINVTGANTYQRAAGSWGVTPAAGDWVNCANFANAANNGHHKVVSATSNTIVVDTTLGPALVNETGSGDEAMTGKTGFEATGLWIDHAADVDVRGLAITDIRHMWGISIDTSTVRGVLLDGVTIQKGTGNNGTVAPIRLPTGTLPDKTAALSDCEGLAFNGLVFKSWGTSFAAGLPISDGTVGVSFGTAAPTITTTNARYFPDGFGDLASSGYTAKVSGTTMANLTSHLLLGE